MQNRILAVPSTLLVTFALVGAMQACEDRSATGLDVAPNRQLAASPSAAAMPSARALASVE